MKKSIKRIIAVCLVFVFAFSLSGCTMASIKARQAFWNEDGSIEWQGSKYIVMEVSGDFYPDTYYDDYISVTERDVPVLLADSFGTQFYIVAEGNLLYGGWDGTLYCKEDAYEEMYDEINNDTEYTKYYYENYGDDSDLWGTNYYLSKAEIELAENIMSEAQASTPIDYEVFYGYDYTWITTLWQSSESGFYTREVYTLYRTEEDFYIWPYQTMYDWYFKVPEEYEDDILEIFRNTDTEYYYDDILF